MIGLWVCLNDHDPETEEQLLGNHYKLHSNAPFIIKLERQLSSRVGEDIDPVISCSAWSWPDQRPLSLQLLDQPCLPPPWFKQIDTHFFNEEYSQLSLLTKGDAQDAKKDDALFIDAHGELQRLALLKLRLRVQLQSRVQQLEELWQNRHSAIGVEVDETAAAEGQKGDTEIKKLPDLEGRFHQLLSAVIARDLPLVHADWLRKRPAFPTSEKHSLALRSLRAAAAAAAAASANANASVSETSGGGKKPRRRKQSVESSSPSLVSVTVKPRPILPQPPVASSSEVSSNVTADHAS